MEAQLSKLLVPHYNLAGYGKRAFSRIAPRLLNRLPTEVVEAPSVDAFKTMLKTFLFKLSDHKLSELCD